MTVATEKVRINHVGDGVELDFPYDFPVLEFDHMDVYLDNVYQTIGYDVLGLGDDAGGTVTFLVAPDNGVVVTLYRWVPQTQLSDYVPYDKFPAETQESNFDLAAMGRQQLQDLAGRMLLLPPNWEGGALQLPPPVPLKVLSTDIDALLYWGDPGGGGAGGLFTDLGDTPNDYTGAAGQLVKVRIDELGLEFEAGGGGAGDVAQTVGGRGGTEGVLAFWGETNGWTAKNIDGSLVDEDSPLLEYVGSLAYHIDNVLLSTGAQIISGTKTFNRGLGSAPAAQDTEVAVEHNTFNSYLTFHPDQDLTMAPIGQVNQRRFRVGAFMGQATRFGGSYFGIQSTSDALVVNEDSGLYISHASGGGVEIPGKLVLGRATLFSATPNQSVNVAGSVYVQNLEVYHPGNPPPPGAGGIAAGVPYVDGELLVATNDTGGSEEAGTQAGLTGAAVNAHVNGATPNDAPHADHVSVNRTHMAAGAVKIAVVAALPGVPDADTLYFVTT